ncbi:hypothetical protein PHYBOEH_003555 [Phytophthora boehmeriae]|uniref:Mediator complex subunit 15 KIX domain-containing protein n=1 Tax=Phytophthora boehmeriae TaxID=109152 RepID=A0A8T1X4S6_9STRA|nr:hypothetical protein PHYBOEH_003555 [Phytophthora boehmeriae]
MDSFGFDFAGGDLLDLGSLGSWTNSTPMGNSPNGGSSGALPFSVGTPTGVQSLGDDPFATMPTGNDHEFTFGDSPKPSPSGHKPGTESATTTSSAPASSSSAPTSQADDLTGPYFGSELDTTSSSSAPSSSTTTATTATTEATADDKSKAMLKTEDNKPKKESEPTITSSSAAQSTSTGTTSSTAKTDATSSTVTATTSSTKPPSSQSGPTSSQVATTTSAANSSSSGAATSAPSTTSSARPHIGNQQQMQMQQRQQQYANQMMMNQQNGQQQFQSYQQMHAGQMATVSGAIPTSAAGQYMGGPQAQGYRQPTSSYDEEFARVKAMMMQHPDLIPPPMEVLRISMSQSANQQNMGGSAAYIQQRGNPGMARGAAGNAAYGHYGNPNVMMGGPQQNAQQANMMNARMRSAQMAQQAQQRAAAGRTPGGSNPADSQAAWQSENDLPLRRKMIGKIVSLLQQRKPDAPAEWIRRLPDMARRLEDSLYRTAKNRDEYGDFSSLKTRLQHLAVTMGARAQHKAGGNPRAGAGAGGVIPGNAGGLNGGDSMKNGSTDSGHMAGVKRTLSQSQQQMAAAANAAAFKRTKVGGAGQAGGQPGAATGQQHPGNAAPGPQTSQAPIQKPVTSSSGSSKTPPMSTVNAK